MDVTHEGKTYHPNIRGQQVKNRKAALTYCAKEDPEPFQYNMDLKQETEAREKHNKILSKDLILGKRTLTQMLE